MVEHKCTITICNLVSVVIGYGLGHVFRVEKSGILAARPLEAGNLMCAPPDMDNILSGIGMDY